MDYFEKLGTLVHQRWREVNYREAEFPRIAYQALKDEPVHAAMDPLEPLRWLMKHAIDLPEQTDLEGTFGQPPLVTFATSRFIIHVLYWLDSTTSIHQHAFCGAFQVVGGSSLHSQFSFDVAERINNRFQLGQLHHRSSELLTQGAVRPIQPNHAFIHSLFHLDHPSISVVIRTSSDPGAEPQYAYSRAGVAVDPFFKDPLTVRQVQTTRTLGKLKHPEFPALVREVLGRSDLPASLALLSEVLAQLRDLDGLEPYLEVVRKRHGSRADALEATLRQNLSDALIASTRQKVTDPDLRFFLALLMNIDQQKRMFEVIGSRYPGKDPRELVLHWLSALSNDPVVENNPLGFELDETTLLVTRCLMEGLSHEQLLRRFEESFDAADVAEQSADLAECATLIRTSPLLRPLFAA